MPYSKSNQHTTRFLRHSVALLSHSVSRITTCVAISDLTRQSTWVKQALIIAHCHKNIWWALKIDKSAITLSMLLSNTCYYGTLISRWSQELDDIYITTLLLFTNHFSASPCSSTWCSSKRMTQNSCVLAIFSLILLASTLLGPTVIFTIANTNISPDGYIRVYRCISIYFMIVFSPLWQFLGPAFLLHNKKTVRCRGLQKI